MKKLRVTAAMLLFLATAGATAGDLAAEKTTGIVLAADSRICDGGKCDVFTADSSEYRTEVVFAPAKDLKDFRFLSLNFRDANDSGVFFDEKEMYHVAALKAGSPLVVRMTFFGDIPSYGISYVDATGKTVRYTLSLSGMDGKPELAPYKN